MGKVSQGSHHHSLMKFNAINSKSSPSSELLEELFADGDRSRIGFDRLGYIFNHHGNRVFSGRIVRRYAFRDETLRV